MIDDTVLASWPEDAFPLRRVQEFIAACFGQREATLAIPIQVYAAYITPPDQRLTARFVVPGDKGKQHEVVYKENRLALLAASARAHALVSKASPPGAVPHVLIWQDGSEGSSRLLYEPFEGRPAEESGAAALIETACTMARIQNAVAESGHAEDAGLPRIEVKDILTAFDSVYDHISKHVRAWEADEDGKLSKCLEFSAAEVLDVLGAVRPQVVRFAEEVASLGLSITVNHNDLHAGNAFVRPDGTVLIYDWEMATLGCPLFSLDKLLVSAWRQDQGLGPGGPWGYVPGTPTQALVRDAYLDELGRPDITPEVFAAAMALACIQEMRTEIEWAILTGWPDGNPEWTAQLIRRMLHHLPQG